eukprot:scaffold5312_cov118-Isochrysis_galbana.AAC.15
MCAKHALQLPPAHAQRARRPAASHASHCRAEQVHAQQISQIMETQHLLLQELEAVSSLAERVVRAKTAAA